MKRGKSNKTLITVPADRAETLAWLGNDASDAQVAEFTRLLIELHTLNPERARRFGKRMTKAATK